MAGDILIELEALDALPEKYRILEVSADLAARQRARLADLPYDVWLTVELSPRPAG